MRTHDVETLCKEYDVTIDTDHPKETVERLLATMHSRAGGRGPGTVTKGGRIEGHGTIEVDPGGGRTAAMLDSIGNSGSERVIPRGAADNDEAHVVKSIVARSRRLPDNARDMIAVVNSPAQDTDERALQSWSDNCHLMGAVLGRPVERLAYFQDAVNKNDRLAAAIQDKSATDALVSDSSAAGGTLAPIGFSALVSEDVRIKCAVASTFVQIRMPTLEYRSAYLTGALRCYLTSQAVDLVPHARDTGTATLTAKGFGAALEWSGELDEDSVTPMLPLALDDLSSTLAEHLESAIINGDDTEGSHIDSCVTYSADVRKAWDGLRYLTHAASLEVDLGTLTVENLRSMTGGMGKYGTNPDDLVWVCSPKTRVKLLSLKDSSNNPMVQTMAQIGPAATILTGQIGVIDGAPVLCSGQMPEYMTSAGVYGDSGGTPSAYSDSVLLQYNRKMFFLGERRPIRMDSDRYVLSDYVLCVGRGRWSWTPRIALNANYPAAFAGINVATS